MQPGRGVRLPPPFTREKREKRRLRRLFSLLRVDNPPAVRAVFPPHRGRSRGQSPPRIGSNAALSLALQGVRGAKRVFSCRFAARKYRHYCRLSRKASGFFDRLEKSQRLFRQTREKPAAFSTDCREKRRLRRLFSRFSLLAATQIIGRTRTAAAPSSRCPTGSPAPRRSISAAAPSAPLPPPVPPRRLRRKTRQ